MRRLLLILALLAPVAYAQPIDTSFTLIAAGTSTNGLATPGAPTVTATGTTGATTWTYKIVAYASDGSRTPVGAGGSATDGNATLDVTNYNALTWTAVTGASSYYVYRTAAGGAPNTTGYLATVTTNAYNDVGDAADSTTAPTSSAVVASFNSGNMHAVNVQLCGSAYTGTMVVRQGAST